VGNARAGLGAKNARIMESVLPSLIKNLRQYGILNILPNWKGIPADLKFDLEISQISLSQTWYLPAKIQNLSLQGVTVRLALCWWADLAEVWLNGKKIATGDLFEQKCRLLLAKDVQVGEKFELEVKLWKPKHDCLGFSTSEILLEYPHTALDPGKFATELEVLLTCLPILEKEVDSLSQILEPFYLRLERFCQRDCSLEDLAELAEIRSLLFPLSTFLKQKKIHILGNSHIDIAWLWAIAETKEVMQRTFSSTLKLQKSYPELIFNQSSALAYKWMGEENPQLFERIKDAIANQKWEPIGGMWIEPDCNLPSGESLIRQILYGKTYFQKELDRDVKIAWLPDTFGFNWQLPQILVKSGFTVFITQKLTWNDTNKFPHSIFWWEGVDGSRIFTYFSNQLGMGIEPLAIAQHLVSQTKGSNISECLWLYGVGDHGGGVTADMLDLGREWNQTDLFFELIPSSATEFIEGLQKKIEIEKISLPIWQDELYLEFHRGTYTSKADQKLKNRQAEILLTNLEKLYAIASLHQTQIYPQAQLDRAWQLLLTNQFHDILTGTSIPEVFTDADLAWTEIENITKKLLDPYQPEYYRNQFCLWNPLNWKRSELIEIDKSLFDLSIDWQNHNLAIVQDCHSILPLQQTADSIIFFTDPLASFGASYFEVSDRQQLPQIQLPYLKITENSLENQYLKISIDPNTGEITQIFDRRSGREVLSDRLQLQFFEDKGQYWDAWNIDPNYQQHQLESATLKSIEIIESGDLRICLEITSQFRNSTIQQEIQLDSFHAYITVRNRIDWQESQILVKAAFPVSFEADFATYEIPMATMTRSTRGETSQAKAKFEVPAQYWADLSGEGIGLSVLNDCKYGYDAQPSCLRLTLLRSPEWTCADSDRGIHNFSYRLIPHAGNWRKAGIVQAGYEFNSPPLILADFPCLADFLTISNSSIIVSAFKRSHSHPNLWILRCYESMGENTSAKFDFLLELFSLKLLDLIENEITSLVYDLSSFTVEFSAYEIKTFGLEFSRAPT
jgi:alpha-mannosidase